MRDVLPWEWLLDIPGRVASAAHTRIRTPPELTWAVALNSCCPSATEKQPQELDERKEGVDREGKKEKWLSMDALQEWALAYPALARLLWVIVLVLATVLVWSLFFCCWGNQSSTSPLERYLSGNTAAFILTQLIWNQFSAMFFSSFQISRNASV